MAATYSCLSFLYLGSLGRFTSEAKLGSREGGCWFVNALLLDASSVAGPPVVCQGPFCSSRASRCTAYVRIEKGWQGVSAQTVVKGGARLLHATISHVSAIFELFLAKVPLETRCDTKEMCSIQIRVVCSELEFMEVPCRIEGVVVMFEIFLSNNIVSDKTCKWQQLLTSFAIIALIFVRSPCAKTGRNV